MKRKPTYHDDLMKRLKNKKYAMGYLNAAFQDNDSRVFLLALRNVAEAWGGMTALSRRTKVPRISLYRILSEKGNPGIHSIDTILKAFGFRLQVTPNKREHLRHAA